MKVEPIRKSPDRAIKSPMMLKNANNAIKIPYIQTLNWVNSQY